MHDGVRSYLDGEQETLYDKLEAWYWRIGLLLSVGGVAFASVRRFFYPNVARKSAIAHANISSILSKVEHAKQQELGTLEHDLNAVMKEAVFQNGRGEISAEELNVLALSAGQVRNAFAMRRRSLRKDQS